MAVLLESMLDRLNNLEKQVNELAQNGSYTPVVPVTGLPLHVSTEEKRVNAKGKSYDPDLCWVYSITAPYHAFDCSYTVQKNFVI